MENKWRAVVEPKLPASDYELAVQCRDYFYYEDSTLPEGTPADQWTREGWSWPADKCDGTIWVGHSESKPCPIHSQVASTATDKAKGS